MSTSWRRTRGFEADQPIDENLPVQVLLMEAVEGGLQLRQRLALLQAQRIEIGFEMANDAIGADELNRADEVLRMAGRGGSGRRLAGLDRVPGQCGDEIPIFVGKFDSGLPGRAAAQLGRG